MSVFPLDIVDKEDTPERLLALVEVPLENKILATDFMEIVNGLKELSGLTPFYLPDNNGLVWRIIKGDGNLDRAAFQAGDKIEAFVDPGKRDWVEGEIMGPGFTGIGDLGDITKFFQTHRKTVRS